MLFSLFNRINHHLQRSFSKHGRRINWWSPLGMQHNLAAPCILRVIPQQRYQPLHFPIHVISILSTDHWQTRARIYIVSPMALLIYCSAYVLGKFHKLQHETRVSALLCVWYIPSAVPRAFNRYYLQLITYKQYIAQRTLSNSLSFSASASAPHSTRFTSDCWQVGMTSVSSAGIALKRNRKPYRVYSYLV